MSQSGLEIQAPSLRLPPNLLTWAAATHWAPGSPHTSKLCHLFRSPTWDQLPFVFQFHHLVFCIGLPAFVCTRVDWDLFDFDE